MAYTPEIPVIVPRVFVNGAETNNLKVISIEDSVGSLPSKATLVVQNSMDMASPSTMFPYQSGSLFQQGMRVRIAWADPDSPSYYNRFMGWLLRRNDQGGPDKVIWTALDDKSLLQWIPVLGCLIRDIDGVLRYSPRHPTHFNPSGIWNCTGIDLGGEESQDDIFPVFTQQAYREMTYESPNATYGDTLFVGKYQPWTPRRILKYLYLMANLKSILGYTPAGMTADVTAQLYGYTSGPARWDFDSIKYMVGTEPGGTIDPLDRKAQDLVVQGETMLGAITKTLDMAGTHKLKMSYSAFSTDPEDPGASTWANYSRFDFANTGWAPTGGTPIYIQRDGSMGQALAPFGSCYDFTFDEDTSQLAENLTGLGDVIKVETEVTYNTLVVDADATGYDNNSIVPVWTKAEEAAFMACVHGGTPAVSGSEWALRPAVHGNTDIGSFQVCDGTGGTVPTPVRSKEAIQIARENFPHVFRAWKINGNNSDIQDILNEDSEAYPVGTSALTGPRQILAEQLQFLVRNLGGGTTQDNWLTAKLPIRCQIEYQQSIDGAGSTAYMDIAKDIGISVTPDGYLWLDALTEPGSGTLESILRAGFNGTILTDDLEYSSTYATLGALRKFKLNLAFPMDQRLRSTYTGTSAAMNDALRNAFSPYGTRLLRVIDAKDQFKRSRQVYSFPTGSPAYYGGEDGTDVISAPLGLLRDLPPGSEQGHLDYAVRRAMAKAINPRREYTFKLMGVVGTWRGGDRVSSFNLKKVDGSEILYDIRACPETVVWNFIPNQTTEIGGLVSEWGA